MLSPRLLVFHLVNLWALSYLTLANDDDGWITVDLNDKNIRWLPALRNTTFATVLKPDKNWHQWSSSSYTAHYANSLSQASVIFNFSGSHFAGFSPGNTTSDLENYLGTAVRVYGGALVNVVNAAATIDDHKAPLAVTFPVPRAKDIPTAFSDILSGPAIFDSGPLPQSYHSLEIKFTDLPQVRSGPGTLAGIVQFRYKPLENSPSSSPAESAPPPSGSAPNSSSPNPPKETTVTATRVTSRPVHSGSPVGSPAPHGGLGVPPNASTVITSITTTIIANGTQVITAFPSPSGATKFNTSGRQRLEAWQITLLVLGLITLFILCFFALRYWRRTRTRTHAQLLVLDNNPPVEVKSASGTLDNRQIAPSTGPDYAFTRPGSSVSTWRDQHWRNSRIGVSPYLYQHTVPYPESTTDQSSHIDPVPIPARRSMLATQPLPGAAVVRQITFSTKGRVLKVQNPDFRSNASTTETETPH